MGYSARPAPARYCGDAPAVLDRRQERSERQHIVELNGRAAGPKRALSASTPPSRRASPIWTTRALKDRIDGLKAIRDQAKADAERAQAMLQNAGSRAVTPEMLSKFARAARQRIRLEGGGYRRDYPRALAQRGRGRYRRGQDYGIEVPAASGAGGRQRRGWRRERDSNPRYGFPYTHFPGVRLQPLGHLSVRPV